MNKQLPEIFKSPSQKKIQNNKNIFYSKYDSVGNVIEKKDNEKVKAVDLEEATTFADALNNLLKNNQFVFNVPVEIITKTNTFNTKIVSKVRDHLLTSNNDVIQLDDIISIKIKEM